MADEQRNYFLISQYYDQYMEDLQRWRREGKTKEEAKQMIDRRVLNDTDVEKVYSLIWDDTEEKNEIESTKEDINTTNENDVLSNGEKTKENIKISEELEQLESEKKKLQRKLAKTKIPKTFYIPTSKFEDLNDYFINKGKNISFSEQVNFAIDKLLKKDVNVELDTTGTELRKIIKEELNSLLNYLLKYDLRTRKSNYTLSFLLIYIMFKGFCNSKEDEESIMDALKEADELGYKMSKETDISITIQNIAKQLNLM